MKKKMNFRFILILSSAILITAGVSMFLFYQSMKTQIFADLKSYEELLAEMDLESVNLPDDVRVTRIAEDGTVLFDSQEDAEHMENHNKRPEIAGAKKNGEMQVIRRSDTQTAQTFYYAKYLPNHTILRVARKSGNFLKAVKEMHRMIFLIALVTIFLCALAAHRLAEKMVEPIERMANNMKHLDETEVYEEIRPFVATIKEQHINILNQAKMRQEFTANVSHELKTPLTAISGYAELIENGMGQEADMKRFAGQIKNNATRLLRLINDIIELSELDDENMVISFAPFDLYETAREMIQMFEISAKQQEISVSLEGEHLLLNGNKDLIEELLYNLISNAVRYNVRGGKIIVKIFTKDGRPAVTVKDTGIGIPKEHQQRIFERFYRVDKSRSKLTGGTGLGLSIVKHIAAQHDAVIELESEEKKGTSITILFAMQGEKR